MTLELSEGVTLSVTDTQGIITDTNSGRYLSVNATALALITRLLHGSTIAAAIQDVASIYDVPFSRVQHDLNLLLESLRELQLIEET